MVFRLPSTSSSYVDTIHKLPNGYCMLSCALEQVIHTSLNILLPEEIENVLVVFAKPIILVQKVRFGKFTHCNGGCDSPNLPGWKEGGKAQHVQMLELVANRILLYVHQLVLSVSGLSLVESPDCV